MHRCKKLRRTVTKFPDNQYIAKLSPNCQNVEGHDPNKIEKYLGRVRLFKKISKKYHDGW